MIEFEVFEAELMPLIWALAKLQPHQVLAVKVPAGEEITPFMNGPIAAAVLGAGGRFGYEHDMATSRIWITRMPAHSQFMPPVPDDLARFRRAEPPLSPEAIASRAFEEEIQQAAIDTKPDPRDPAGEDEEAYSHARRRALEGLSANDFARFAERRHLGANDRETATAIMLDADLASFRRAKEGWNVPIKVEAEEEARVDRIEQALKAAIEEAPVVATEESVRTLISEAETASEFDVHSSPDAVPVGAAPSACSCGTDYRSVAEPVLKGYQSWHDRGDWHEGLCPQHAHHFKLPGPGQYQGSEAIQGVCRCGEVKSHTNASLAKASPAKGGSGLCPDCGAAYASLKHKQCREAKAAAEASA